MTQNKTTAKDNKGPRRRMAVAGLALIVVAVAVVAGIDPALAWAR